MLNSDDITRAELSETFKRVGPICEDAVAVFDGQSEFHVDRAGVALYKERYAYVGSFCNKSAWVRTKGKNAREFHIRKNGTRLYANEFRTVADFDASGHAKASEVEGIEFLIGVTGERVPDV